MADSSGAKGIFTKYAGLLCAAALCLSCELAPATTTPQTYADFLKLASQLSCETSLRCCGTLCDPVSDATFYMPSDRAFAYLRAGLLSYDRQAAVDCLAAMQQRYTSCDAAVISLPPLTACGNVLSPQAGSGSMCETGISSCRPDTVCVNGTCTLRRSVGQSCGVNPPTCLSDLDSCCMACTGVCQSGLAIGQACLFGSTATPCQPGSFCPSVAGPKCTAYATAGQACIDTTLPCLPNSGLFCLPVSQTCGPPQENGASCRTAAYCASGYCQLAGLAQGALGTCQPQPVPRTLREDLCLPR